jgi:hypothetical protein
MSFDATKSNVTLFYNGQAMPRSGDLVATTTPSLLTLTNLWIGK